MIINGTRPLKRPPRRHFHRQYGATLGDIADFTLDRGLWNGNQIADNAPTECTGYTVSRIITNMTGIVRDPDFHYAAALYIEGSGPSVAGADIHAAMQAAVGVGSLPAIGGTISAGKDGELFVSDWRNWTPEQKVLARKTVQNGTLNALGLGSPFDSILSAVKTSGTSASIGTPWLWQEVPDDGRLAMPAHVYMLDVPWHNWVVEGKKTINHIPYLECYSHQGTGVGNRGKTYLDRETTNALFAIPGTGAIVFDPNAVRWFSLVAILIQRFPALLPMLPKLINA